MVRRACSGRCTHSPEYRPEEGNDGELIAQVSVTILQKPFTRGLQSSSHPHKVVNISGLKGLEKGIDAKEKISQIDPVVIIPKAFGLDDTDQRTSDDYNDTRISITSQGKPLSREMSRMGIKGL